MGEFGFMLAYTPLHVLLLGDAFEALVMTSANLSEEPIAIGNDEARRRLGEIADFFLLHDRAIVQRCDDSVVRIIDEVPAVVRRSRGYVPDPVELPLSVQRPVLACGGELKNTVGLASDRSVVLSQHIGDLDNPEAYRFFEGSIEHLSSLLEISPDVMAFDMHPEYLSSKWARDQNSPALVPVQHHHAHLAAVLAENGRLGPSIGIILDGTGYGLDGTIWGGEVLVGGLSEFKRFAWLKPFPLPGGSAAIRQPWRTGFALCHSLRERFPDGVDGASDLMCALVDSSRADLLEQVISRRINSPLTSSCGRLFDGVSAILGLKREISFEAEAAIALEMVADPDAGESYFSSGDGAPFHPGGPLDWSPMLVEVVRERVRGDAVSKISARFHHSLSDLLVSAALGARMATGIATVGLSGGVFQNMLLFNDLRSKLQEAGFEVLWHTRLPTNDGGLAYGQAAVAAARISKSSSGG
jgi:hydrogenase maturation protein HypF